MIRLEWSIADRIGHTEWFVNTPNTRALLDSSGRARPGDLRAGVALGDGSGGMRLCDHLARVILAEEMGVALRDDGAGSIVISALADGGQLRELGRVSVDAMLQDPEGASLAVERIMFGRR